METDGMNEFVVDTEGQCFLCLSQIKTPFSCLVNKCPIYSLQDLSQYLKLNRRGKVFHEKNGIPQELLDKVENEKLKVELCERCGGLSEQFSKLFRRLEKVEMEIGDCLSHILERLEVSGKTGQTVKCCNSTGDSGRGKQEVVEALRSEVMQKCFIKDATRLPRVEMELLPLRKGHATIRKLPLEAQTNEPVLRGRPNLTNSYDDPEQLTIIDEAGDPVKNEPFDGDWGDSYPDDNTDEMDLGPIEGYSERIKTEEGPAQEPAVKLYNLRKKKPVPFPVPVTTVAIRMNNHLWKKKRKAKAKRVKRAKAPTGSTLPQCVKNPETGKFKCSLCEREFTTLQNCQTHHKASHLKEKQVCELCGKGFLHFASLYEHNQTVHLGIRFQCERCGIFISSKRHLMRHVRGSRSCREGFPSRSCPRPSRKKTSTTSTNDNVSDPVVDHVDNNVENGK